MCVPLAESYFSNGGNLKNYLNMSSIDTYDAAQSLSITPFQKEKTADLRKGFRKPFTQLTSRSSRLAPRVRQLQQQAQPAPAPLKDPSAVHRSKQ